MELLKLIIRLMVKLLIFPVIVVLTLIKWALLFVATFMAVFTNLLSGIIFVTAVLSYLMGQESRPAVLRMLAFSFGVFVLPYVLGWFIEIIDKIKCAIKKVTNKKLVLVTLSD